MMRRCARLHPDKAARKIGEKSDYFRPTQLTPHQDGRSLPIACTWNTFFARSNPTVTTSCFICRLLDMDLQRPHHGTATLVQGPSTPSRHRLEFELATELASFQLRPPVPPKHLILVSMKPG